jgi:hypothetical protein
MLLEEVVGVARHHLHVLGGDAVGLLQHLLVAVADDHLAVVAPGLPAIVGGGQDGSSRSTSAMVSRASFSELVSRMAGRGRAVLGLAEQVGGADLGVHGVVGDHQRLGRPGEQVDADAAEELALGLGDEGVARADQHVDRRDRLGAERHRADRLHAAEHVDLVGAGQVHRRDDGRVRLALEGRRAGDDRA